MKTTRLPTNLCPFCFHKLDAATSALGEYTPEPGDYTICLHCAQLLRFDEGMHLAKSSLQEVPMHSRLKFAKLVALIRDRGPNRELPREPWKC